MKQICLSPVPPESDQREQFRQQLQTLNCNLLYDKIGECQRNVIAKWLKEQELKSLQEEREERRRNKNELRKRDEEHRRQHPRVAFCSSVMKDMHLDEDIRDCKYEVGMLENVIADADDKRTALLLTQEQKRLEFALVLLYKFTADESVRADIDKKTRALCIKWERWRKSKWRIRENGIVGVKEDGSCRRGNILLPKSYKQLVDGIRRNLSTYEKMLNKYAKRKPKNDAALASKKQCEQLQARMSTMSRQAAIAIDAAYEQGYKAHKAKVDNARNKSQNTRLVQ